MATHADLETVAILRDTDHLRLKHNVKYALGDFASRLSQRADVTEKLFLAFQGLLGVVREDSSAKKIYSRGEISLMEAGLVARDDEYE